MKTKSLTTTLFILISLAAFMSFTYSSEEESLSFEGGNEKDGFYVKDGTIKISEMDCYSFSDLTYKFSVSNEMFAYDKIRVEIIKHFKGRGVTTRCFKEYDTRVFKAKHQNKKISEITIFEDGAQGTEMRDVYDDPLYRAKLKFTNSDDGMDGFYLQTLIKGSLITGYSEEYVNGKVIQEPIYGDEETIYEGTKLPLTNRTKMGRLKLAFKTTIDLSEDCDSHYASGNE